jgi:hypothetical protein
MRSFPESDTIVATDSIARAVMVSMLDEHLVICAPDHLDLEMTEVLVFAAASAVASGSTVMIDLDPDIASHDLIARRPLGPVGPSCLVGDGRPVSVLGAGYVRLATRDAYWTIDLSQGRLCCSHNAIEPHFVRTEDWTRIQAIWVSQTSVTALTADDRYLSTRSAWTA